MNDSVHPKSWGFGVWLLVVIIPLIAGLLLSLFIPQPVIGTINLNDAIYSTTASDMISQIRYARAHPEIKAVVLVLNTPGGTVTDTESVYMEISRLRQEKPVISVVEGMAASGGYYLLSGTDYVFAKPSSEVGNIGVIGYLPPAPAVLEEVYSTGPYKMWGEPRDTAMREMEMLKQGFYSAVTLGRGGRLKVPREVILRGQIYPGSEALRMGLIDELGSVSQGYDKAAEMTHISHYRIEDLRTLASVPTPPTNSLPLGFFQTRDGVSTGYPNNPGIYMLYIPNAEGQP
jgi:protease IV